jgi:PDZ domain-containing protein
VLLVNGKLLLKTPVQGGTLAPTWPEGPAGNFRLKETDRFRVELWDSNTINDHPIGVKEMGRLEDDVERSGEADVECDSGAHVRIAFEPAHGRLGLGFYYELRIGEVYVTRMYQESPAGRAGIKPGDQIMMLDGKKVASMKADEVKSVLNTPHMNGLALTIRRPGGEEQALTLKEGAIYPLFSEMGTLR